MDVFWPVRARVETRFFLYRSGVAYQEDPRWQDLASMLTSRHGDCKDLVAWRLAELRELYSTDARLHVVFTKLPSGDVFHLQIRLPDGQIEDPVEIVRSAMASGTLLPSHPLPSSSPASPVHQGTQALARPQLTILPGGYR